MLSQVISKNSILLALFAAVTTAGIAGTYLGTKDIIAEQKRRAEQAALAEVMPTHKHNNSLLDSTIPVSNYEHLKLTNEKKIYVAKQDQQLIGYVIPAIAPDGYTGAIELIVGINVDGSVSGVRVLAHRETPGLGDAVELSKSEWILGFNERSLGNPSLKQWKVKKDKGVFDQFTGATITPRAVTKAVKKSLEYYQLNKDQLAQQAADLPFVANEPLNQGN